MYIKNLASHIYLFFYPKYNVLHIFITVTYQFMK